MNFDTQVRRIYKPLLFVACLLPAARLVAGACGIAGQSLGTDPVHEILHTCGKWTLNFLLITLCVTPLRELTGLNSLLRLRRMFGLFAFTYACAHFLSYLLFDQGLDWRAILEDIVKRPYITIGFTALLLLLPLAVTSTNRMMRRLGRRWQKLHRLIYVIALLGVWHFYWQVKADVREPLIYAGILTALLGYRSWRTGRRSAPALRAGARAASMMANSTSSPPPMVSGGTGS